ncbi:MAG TPA: DinB family protein [Thermomicrobiaceae bacterium]|nr:DinB family protein [Thermomicrobiaceae bacterium]
MPDNRNAESDAAVLDAVREQVMNDLRSAHQSWRELVQAVDPACLAWVPGEEMNSIATLAQHSCGSEAFLLATALGEAIERDRAAEFTTPVDAAGLLQLIDRTEASSDELLQRLQPNDLTEIRRPANDRLGRQLPGSWWLFHAAQHHAEHLGHAGITRQFYEQGLVGEPRH